MLIDNLFAKESRLGQFMYKCAKIELHKASCEVKVDQNAMMTKNVCYFLAQ